VRTDLAIEIEKAGIIWQTRLSKGFFGGSTNQHGTANVEAESVTVFSQLLKLVTGEVDLDGGRSRENGEHADGQSHIPLVDPGLGLLDIGRPTFFSKEWNGPDFSIAGRR